MIRSATAQCGKKNRPAQGSLAESNVLPKRYVRGALGSRRMAAEVTAGADRVSRGLFETVPRAEMDRHNCPIQSLVLRDYRYLVRSTAAVDCISPHVSSGT